MAEARFMTIEEAHHIASSTAQQLLAHLAEFNRNHPDPDAERVVEYFDYFTRNYVVQTCASVLAARHVVLPTGTERPAFVTQSAEDGDEMKAS